MQARGPHHPCLLSLLLCALLAVASPARATIFLITKNNATFSFDDADAAFGGPIPATGMSGYLQPVAPLDACDPLDRLDPLDTRPYFALIRRGGCEFDVKVLNAQLAGYSAAVVFNNEESDELITMSGRHLWALWIPAVFVTLATGKQLQSLVKDAGTACHLTPALDNAAWSIMTASLLSLAAVSGVIAGFLCMRQRRARHLLALRLLQQQQQQQQQQGEVHVGEGLGMPASQVKALPEMTFGEALAGESSMGLDGCAICLEEYEVEDKLRMLPCRHLFHAECVDQWLTTRRPFCPVCKRDAAASFLDTAADPEGLASAANGGARSSSEQPRWWILRRFMGSLRRPRHWLPFRVITPLREPLIPFPNLSTSAEDEGEMAGAGRPEAAAADVEAALPPSSGRPARDNSSGEN